MGRPRFKENWKAVAGTSIKRGAYHFLEPDVDGTRQAKHFLATVELEAGDLLPVVDVETRVPTWRPTSSGSSRRFAGRRGTRR